MQVHPDTTEDEAKKRMIDNKALNRELSQQSAAPAPPTNEIAEAAAGEIEEEVEEEVVENA
jgi:hypothetical protein